MFIFTEPYISPIALDFIKNSSGDRIITSDFLNNFSLNNKTNFISNEEAQQALIANDGRWLYSNSENALVLIDELLPKNHRLRECIELFKNKHLFRQRYDTIYPGVEYNLLTLDNLLDFKFSDFNKPFIIKPSVGFLSAGVYRVNSQSELESVQTKIITEMKSMAGVFPKSVLDSSSFIVESIISGREFAIDAYYSDKGEPVIVDIFEHIFRDDSDMSDRLYVTSHKIIKEYLKPFTEFLNKLKSIIDLKGFALHAEVRVDSNGVIIPIEINPLRFAGWCCTDLCYYAYGINPYQCFADRKIPDWESICKNDNNKAFGMSVISSTLINQTKEFNYEKLKSQFSDLKEFRQIDFSKYPLFGFAFFSFDLDDTEFCNWLLHENFINFCELK